MNGSRSTPLRNGENPSIDALNRTIQGLEARIEGLMAPAHPRDMRSANDVGRTADSVSEIVMRQRALAQSRGAQDAGMRRDDRSVADEIRARLPQNPTPSYAAPAIKSPDAAMQDIAQALVGLRHELKKDISEGVSREVQQLRSEIRGIKSSASEHSFAEDMRDDLAKLADSINRLGHQASPSDAASLRAEFNELRSAIDGLAREDSLRHMESRWTGVEQKLSGFNATALQDDVLSLAYQLDDIKSHLGSMSAAPAVQMLESRLISLASEIETMGKRMQPNDRVIAEQFAGLDLRLDEISRAIAAANRSSSPSLEPHILKSFESKINQLAEAIELVSPPPADMSIAPRIEALAARVEELLGSASATRLDERLDQLSRVMENSLKSDHPPELANYLSDISRKIDALDTGSVNNELAKQLGLLARRIEDFGTKPGAPMFDNSASMNRLEGRLDDIAARLDQGGLPAGNGTAFHNLEAQIANLSALLNRSGPVSGGVSPELEHRMAALEDYMATSDEFIMQAARQAAEAVAEAYGRSSGFQGSAPAVDVSVINALSDDLRHLEEMTRSSEQRTHKTFEALHDTLVQIAHRLDRMDSGTSVRNYEDSYSAPRAAASSTAPAPKQTSSPAYQMSETAGFAGSQTSSTGSNRASDPALDPMREPMALVESARQDFSRLHAETEQQFEKQARPVQQTANFAEPARTVVQPPPATDAVDSYQHSADDNLLLEPGSGVPDVKKILAKVRAAQDETSGSPSTSKLSDSEKADFISAARRAARDAAAEIENSAVEAPTRQTVRPAEVKKESVISKSRRALLVTVGFIVLGVMTYPMLKTLIVGKPSPAQVSVSQTEAPAQDTKPATSSSVAEAPAADPSKTADPAEAAQKGPAESNDLPSFEQATKDSVEAASKAPAAEPAPAAPTETADATLPLQPIEETPAAPKLADATPAAAPVSEPAIEVADTVGPASLVSAARSGDPLALLEIGTRYTDGRGVKADLTEAAKWYALAADKGQAVAQYRLANLYEKGTGVDRDIAKAKALYEKAAEQGNASAMHNLAVLAATGADGKPDMDTASKWFKQAADLGVKDSQFNLAILYARGTGVAPDLTESYKWFAVAARDGDADAAQKRDEVAKAMKPDQLNSAKAKFDAWKRLPTDAATNNPVMPDEWLGKGTNTSSIDMKKAITNIQAILNNNGYDVGKPDGKMGAKTVAAIKSFQTSVGQKPTGEITDMLVKELLARNKK